MSVSLAFRSFFALLFKGRLSDNLIADLGLAKKEKKEVKPEAPPVRTSDGALQMLSILQRDSRLIDFLMEEIAPYSDEQVGAAVRSVHEQCRKSLAQYVTLQPVIDGVEGAFTKTPSGGPGQVRFIGNVPAGTPPGGTLRHRGWRAVSVSVPDVNPRQDNTIIAPAEIEIE